MMGADAMAFARKLTKLYAPLFMFLGLLEMAILLLLRKASASIFTHDSEVRHLVEHTMIFLAVFVIFDATTCYCHGVLRGLGRQAYGGWVAFVVNFFYAVPLAIYLELSSPHLGLSGVWVATGSCLATVTTVEVVILTVMDWQKCVNEARDRETEYR